MEGRIRLPVNECLNTRSQELCDTMLCKAITALEDSVLASLSPSSPPLLPFLPLISDITHYLAASRHLPQHPTLISRLFGNIFAHPKTCQRNKKLRHCLCVCVCVCEQHKVFIPPAKRGSNDEQPFDYLTSLIITPCLST